MALHPSVDSQARTATGNSSPIGLGRLTSSVSVLLAVTAVSGTSPSLTVSVQWSHDEGVTWFNSDPADSFTAVTAATNLVRTFTVRAPHFRIRWTITGTTPSFTFTASTFYGREGRTD